MENLEILHKGNQFYIGDENDPAAFISYVPSGEKKIIIDHTIVKKELEGQGIAGKLLDTLVEWARKEDISVLATCGYAVNKMKDNPEYDDVYMK
ncbi:MAG: GNAT family N-acetyltransferase [Tissierellia bacterium]|nr:GNAT family N-acetyltransferase [Tissierellia bacterium]